MFSFDPDFEHNDVWSAYIYIFPPQYLRLKMAQEVSKCLLQKRKAQKSTHTNNDTCNRFRLTLFLFFSSQIPTLTQLGIRSSPVGVVFGAGMQLAAVVAIPLFW